MRVALAPALVNDAFGDPGLFVDFLFERRAMLFDLGDLHALPPRKILRISDIFVSHCHMDHFIGFDWFLRICLGRERRVRLYGPPGFIDQVAAKLRAYTWNLVQRYENDFCLTVHEFHEEGRLMRAAFRVGSAFRYEALDDSPIPDGLVLDEPEFRVRVACLDHGIPCLAYSLEECQHVNIWKNRLQAHGLEAGPWLKALKSAVLRGVDPNTLVETTDMQRPIGSLMDCVRLTPGSKLTYVTDVAYSDENAARIVALSRNADWLFIESVFMEADRVRAADKKHLTAAQAGRLARAAGVRAVIPFHFSPIYRDREDAMRQELSDHFHAATTL